MKKLLLISLGSLFCIQFLKAQEQNDSTKANAGFTVFDRFGNLYSSEMAEMPPSTFICQAGYYALYSDYTEDGLTASEEAVLCQVYSDLSAFIIPGTATTPNINISVSDVTAEQGQIASASSYYINYANHPELVDPVVWQMINGGVDPFSNLTGYDLLGAYTYHGTVRVNASTYDFHTDLSTGATGTDIDLYSVVLHEAIHSLGFGSAIGAAGLYGFWASNIYTRYDSYLETSMGINLLQDSSNPFEYTYLSGYNYLYDYDSNCDNALIFNGPLTYEPVFTSSDGALSGSNLSHLISNCGGSPAYVMDWDMQAAYTLRTLTQNEVYTLCDLGYKTASTYGNPSYPLSYQNNYDVCGFIVAGNHDFTFANGEPLEMTYDQTLVFNSSDLLYNDVNATGIEHIEVLTAGASLTPVQGGNYAFEPNPISAVQYLRYIPKYGTKTGNTTYVIIHVTNASLCFGETQDECNLVCGGDFESSFLASDYQNILAGFEIEGVNPDNTPDLLVNPSTGNHYISMGYGSEDKHEGITFELQETLQAGVEYELSMNVSKMPVGELVKVAVAYSDVHPCTDMDNPMVGSYSCLSGSSYNGVYIDQGYAINTTSWTPVTFTFTPSFDANYLSIFNSFQNPGAFKQARVDDVYIQAVSLYINAGEDVEACYGEAVVLGGTPPVNGATTYTWLDSDGNFYSNAPNPVVYVTEQSQTFTLQVSSSTCNLTSSDQVTVTGVPCCDVEFNPLPDQTFCVPEGVVLGASLSNMASFDYYWEGSDGSTYFTAQPFISPTSPVNYTLTVSSVYCGEVYTDQVSVTPDYCCNVSMQAPNDYSLCLGDSYQLVALGVDPGENFYWDGPGLSGVLNDNPWVSPSTQTSYTLHYMLEGCAMEFTDEIVVNVNNQFYAWDLGPDQAICIGDSTTLGIPFQTGYSYSWSSSDPNFVDSGQSFVTITPTDTYNYTLTLTGTDCASAVMLDQVSVEVYPAMSLDLGPDQSLCLGDNITIGIPSQAGHTYSWSSSDPNFLNSGQSLITISPTNSYTYTLEISGLFCPSPVTDQIAVEVINQTTSLNLGPDQTICIGDGITIGIPSLAGYSYSWSSSDPNFVNNGQSQISISPTDTYTYTLTQTGLLCSSVQMVDQMEVVVLNQILPLNLGPDQDVCLGSITSLGPNPIPGYTYQWYENGQPSSTTTPLLASPAYSTTYSLEITSPDCGLVASDQVLLTVNRILADLGPDRYYCPGETLSLTVGILEGTVASYVWFDENGNQLSTTGQTLTVTPTQSTSYDVVVFDIYGCSATAHVELIEKQNCCEIPLDALDYNNQYSSSYGEGVSDETIYINSLFIVDQGFAFSNCEIYLGSDALIELIASTNLYFKNCTLKACQEELWDGIYLDNSFESIHFNESYASDAINVIHAVNDAEVLVQGSTFENNYVGIYMKDYTLSNANVNIVLNTFTKSGALYPPYQFSSALGIELRNIKNVQIGANPYGLYQNHFSNFKAGIYAVNSKLRVENAQFTNNGRGIYNQSFALSGNPTFNTDRQTQVSNCHFTGGNYGIYARGLSNFTSGMLMLVYNNSFEDIGHKAIYGLDLKQGTTINYNNISSSTYGICLANVNVPLSAQPIHVYSNSLSDIAKKGIWTQNIGNIAAIGQVHDNTISYNFGNKSERMGICIENCDYLHVYDNSISRDPNPSYSSSELNALVGIWIEESQNSLISDNSLSYLGHGIHGLGLLQNTQFSCNQLQYNYHGIHFDLVNQTIISNQGTASSPSDNTWLDGAFTGAMRIEGDFWSYPNWHYRTGFLYDAFQSSTNTINYFPGATGENTCSWAGGAPSEKPMLIAIAQGDYTYASLDEQYKHREKKKAYSSLRQEPSLYSNELILQNFVALMQDSPLEKILQVNEKMSLGDFEAAILKNQAILSDKQYILNRKTVDGIYLNLLSGDTLSTADSLSLRTIALLTPYLGGDAVYSARVLLDIDAMDYGIAYRDDGAQIKLELPQKWVRIYPNPTEDQLTIDVLIPTEKTLYMRIFDINGKEVVHLSLAEKTQSLAVDHLAPGSYMYKLYTDGQTLQQGKLIKTPKH